jgi:hypothetical protein
MESVLNPGHPFCAVAVIVELPAVFIKTGPRVVGDADNVTNEALPLAKEAFWIPSASVP